MRILMIAPQPFFQPRGTPFSVLARVRALTDLGHEVDLVTYPLGEDADSGSSDLPDRESSVPKIHPHRAVLDQVSPRHPRFGDHASTPDEEPIRRGPHARRGGRHRGPSPAVFSYRHVYDMHSSLPEQLRNYGWTRLEPVISLMRWFERWVVRRSDVVIAVCPELVRCVNALAGQEGAPH